MKFKYLAVAAALAAAPATIQAQQHFDPTHLSHVERILVIDSIAVPKADFFKAYRLAPSAGTILTGAQVEDVLKNAPANTALTGSPMQGFTNEFNDYIIWAQPDSTGFLRLAESSRLIDGSWSMPTLTPTLLNTCDEEDNEQTAVANAAYPFMNDDGQTLFFASDNDLSLGGYDIFVATKDPYDGSFLKPGNLGLPFNSEADDYMMAVDELTGVGWWATDRNHLGDDLTVYIYALTDERENVDPSDPELMSYATLSGWENLIDDDARAEVERLRKEIRAIKPLKTKEFEFTLPMPEGQTYHYFSDFEKREAADAMHRLLRSEQETAAMRKSLYDLRDQYHKSAGDKSLAEKIQELETRLREQVKTENALRSRVYQLELEE